MYMGKFLNGQIAVITGGGNGIGRAICFRLALDGAHVIVTDLVGIQAAKVAEEIIEGGGSAESAQLDVTNDLQAKGLIKTIIDNHGNIDIWCNNAGVSTMNHVWKQTEENWDYNMDVNAKGTFLCSNAVLPYMIKHRRGRIINISSIAGLRADPLLAPYCASKWAVVGLTKTMAYEVGKYGVNVNCVCPGFVKTSMHIRELSWSEELLNTHKNEIVDRYIKATPLGRIGEPSDIAKAVSFLAGPDSDFITGAALPVTGGLDLL
jgi:NAD(P)-dependent dehydrogenase (short-subunit alcohol dehydrogenase family)